MTDSLGDRIKRYERVYSHTATPRMPLFIRVDGKAFHTFTRGCEKPFDQGIINSMAYAAKMTSQEMSGFKLAYIQSDEATFMIGDYDNLDTQGWFNYEINKVVSIAASAFTAHFNHFYYTTDNHSMQRQAMFDARAFSVPLDDAPNVFIWRQRDWERNSVQMYARAYFTHKECEGKKIPELHDMLHERGLNWAKLSNQLKNGTFVDRNGDYAYGKVTYEILRRKINGDI